MTRRHGFTLVEMLVVVAIVLIMMSMFASIFSIVTTSMSQQRGIAENDQRGRLLSMTIRGDLDRRTFRDVLPFRANEDTRQLGHSLSRRAGYFEIDEGDPNSDIDDVLQFTTSVNIQLQTKDATPYIGNVPSTPMGVLSGVTASGYTLSFTDGGTYLNALSSSSRLWIYSPTASPVTYYPCTANGAPYLNASNNTQLNIIQNFATAVTGNVIITENQPDFDDGVWGNSIATSACAEVSYFLRNGNLYRRVLLIRDKQPGTDSQPSTTTGQLLLWNSNYQTGVDSSSNPVYGAETYPTNVVPVAPSNNPVSIPATTFWSDYDYSAVFYTGDSTTGIGTGVRFHNSSESLNNANVSSQVLTNPAYMLQNSTYNPSTLPFTLGIPNWRFGHSNINGLTQDVSSKASLANGTIVTIGRFLAQECADPTFGYPGYLPYDPVSGVASVNPVDRQNILVDSVTGLVVDYSSHVNNLYYVNLASQNSTPLVTNTNRRGADLIMSNVLTFDVKVWDAVASQFVDIGSTYTVQPVGFTSAVNGAFSANAQVMTDSYPLVPFAQAVYGNIVGGRLNSAYCGGLPPTVAGTSNSYNRFDTWHPNAFTVSTSLNSYQVGASTFYEPPYYSSGGSFASPYYYNEPPYLPWVINPYSGLAESAPLTAIQIRINYRDVSSNQIRQMTIVQSLVDRLKSTSVTNQSPEE